LAGTTCSSPRFHPEWEALARRRGLARIVKAPDRAARILRHQEAAVLVDGDANWAAPRLRIIDDESGGEILIFAARHAVLHNDANDFVAGAFGAVPRTVLGGKNIAAVLGRKLRAVIERHAERSRMGRDEHVRDGDLVLQVAPLASVARVLVRADVVPGPAVECALAHASDVV